MPDRRSLRTALRKYRLEQDLTYAELAGQIGLSRAVLYAFLRKKATHLTINERTQYQFESFLCRMGVWEKAS